MHTLVHIDTYTGQSKRMCEAYYVLAFGNEKLKSEECACVCVCVCARAYVCKFCKALIVIKDIWWDWWAHCEAQM